MPGSQFFDGAKPVVFPPAFRAAPGLPELIGESGDLLFVGLVTDGGLVMLRLFVQVGVVGVLEAVPGAFVSGQMVFFSVMLAAGTVRVSSKVTVLGSYLL
jgi:hypothetical protein